MAVAWGSDVEMNDDDDLIFLDEDIVTRTGAIQIKPDPSETLASVRGVWTSHRRQLRKGDLDNQTQVRGHVARVHWENQDIEPANSSNQSAMVVEVSSVAAFNEALSHSTKHLVVVEFFASWCPPCRMIAPAVEQLSEEMLDVKFFKVNVDTVSVVAQRESIRAMPTFKFYRNGVSKETIQGANIQLVRTTIERLRPPPPLIEEVLELASGPDTEGAREASEILIRIADNILREPLNPKYRRLKIANRIVSEKLLPVDGAMQCLIAMGFNDNNEDAFVLEPEAPLNQLRLVRGQIEKIVIQGQGTRMEETEKKESAPQDPPKVESPAPPAPTPPRSSSPPPQQVSTPPMSTVTERAAEFLATLRRNNDLMAVYEHYDLQEKARRAMNWESLSSRVNVANTRELVLELLRWFKYDFFSWMDAPNCIQCGAKCSAIGMGQPTLSEAEGWASRIELYRCPQQHPVQRFPRYNHPGRLLESRTGRCGEFANAFMLILRAAGVRSRYIYDWTDHVWCEVFIDGRWMHCDPCENTLDKPLVYECGWGKKLNYIIGFSLDDIQDVTWRYTRQPKEVLKRRTKVSEEWLTNAIVELRTNIQSRLSEADRAIRTKETLAELVEFLSVPKDPEGDELSGRQSGSAEWRRRRGEMGNVKTGKVIRPLKEELASNQLELRYSCARDEYERPTASENSQERRHKGWASYAESATNIQRKHEIDWKMVYLSRIEGSPASEDGTISWTVDLNGSGRTVSAVKLLVNGAQFESGRVNFSLCGDEEVCVPVRGFFTSDKTFNGCRKITLTATLGGGDGSNAFQHAQLFRQKDSDQELFPLNLIVEFNEASLVEDAVE